MPHVSIISPALILPRKARGRKKRGVLFFSPRAFRGELEGGCVVFIFSILFLAALSLPAFGEPSSPSSFDEALLAEVQKLQALKETQPALYQQKIREMKSRLQSDLGELKTRRPQEYRRFVQRERELDRRHSEYVRQRRSDLYPAYVERRRNRIDRLEQKNPERFQSLMQQNPRLRERWEQRQERRDGQNFSTGRLSRQSGERQRPGLGARPQQSGSMQERRLRRKDEGPQGPRERRRQP